MSPRRTIQRLAVATVALFALAGSAATAEAHKVQYPSSVEILGFGSTQPEGPIDFLWGRVSSPRAKCVGGRTLTLKREISGQPFEVDTAVTSKNGFFAVGGASLELGGFVLVDKQRLDKKKKGNKKGKGNKKKKKGKGKKGKKAKQKRKGKGGKHRHVCSMAYTDFPGF